MALKWRDPYELPYLLQAANEYERDQRVSEKSDTDSEDSRRDDNSWRESAHESDDEPALLDYPSRAPVRVLKDGETGFPVPLGVYVQFENLVLPDIPELMDQYQPAVYGYMRRRRGIYARKEYDGLEINIAGTGREGKWILVLQISNHTQDGSLIGRPLDRATGIKLTGPKLRLRPDYRLKLNPDTPQMRRSFITEFLRDLQQHECNIARKRYLRRQQEGLKARRYRQTIRWRWRHLRRRRRRNAQHRRDVYEIQRERVEARRERGEEVESPTPPGSPPGSESVPSLEGSPVRRPRVRVRRGEIATPEDLSPVGGGVEALRVRKMLPLDVRGDEEGM